jgi:hypothetical protein
VFTGPPRSLGFQENPDSAAQVQQLLGGIDRSWGFGLAFDPLTDLSALSSLYRVRFLFISLNTSHYKTIPTIEIATKFFGYLSK